MSLITSVFSPTPTTTTSTATISSPPQQEPEPEQNTAVEPKASSTPEASEQPEQTLVVKTEPAPTAAESKSVFVAQIEVGDAAEIGSARPSSGADELAAARASAVNLASDRRVDAVLSQMVEPAKAPMMEAAAAAERKATQQAEQAVQTVREMESVDSGEALAVYA